MHRRLTGVLTLLLLCGIAPAAEDTPAARVPFIGNSLTYVAALMFFEHLTGRTPVGLPDPATSKDRALREVRLSPAHLRVAQEAAAEAHAAPAVIK